MNLYAYVGNNGVMYTDITGTKKKWIKDSEGNAWYFDSADGYGGGADAGYILSQVDVFNTLWLIGLFFFGFHLILLSLIVKEIPKFISVFLIGAGVMYIVDTGAHFLLADYNNYKDIFLTLVAIPSIFGEMALALWFLFFAEKRPNICYFDCKKHAYFC